MQQNSPAFGGPAAGRGGAPHRRRDQCFQLVRLIFFKRSPIFKYMKQRAFSLVELSIVLVILGLLTGGILGGQSLIRAAELRSVSTDYARYQTAMATFRDKYFALPGDMTNATAFWGKDNTNCSGDTGTAATPGTCNGNGNGLFENAAAGGQTGEVFQFWKQLALAGLIEGTYSGLSGPVTGVGGGRDAVLGTNVPRARLANAGYSLFHSIVPSGHSDRWDIADGNHLNLGAENPNHYETDAPILKPEEAWNIDTKMDDGLPAQGRLISYKDGLNPGCASPQTDATARYALSVSSVVCAFQLRLD